MSPSPLGIRTPRRPQARIGAKGKLPRSLSVLLLVDVINPLDFPGAERLAAPALAAARAIARLRARLAEKKVMTIFANDNYGRWQSDFRQTYEHCVSCGGSAEAIAQLLAPGPRDLILLKPRHSAFFATPLDLVLSQMHTRRVVIAGFAADICVQLTAMDATLRGFTVAVPSDCCAAESPSAKASALAYMKRVLKADIRRSSSLHV